MKMEDNKLKSLYIHIPFCDHICSYCDFKKMVGSDELKEKYIIALIKELNFKKNYFSDLETIYIGGGTPSSLPFYLLKLLLDCLKENINLNNLIEFTIEINPNDINEENINNWINIFKDYNITRISLGIQSFNNKKLQVMNRNHDKKQALKSLKLLHKHKFNNVNVDLIYGFDFDNFNLIKKDINLSIKNHVKHISYYSLILEENTILYNRYLKNQFIPLDDDKEGILYKKIYKYLKKKKYYRYEISNFSKENYYSRYNFRVWNNEHYLACGVSASYYIKNTRYTNINSIQKYIEYINNSEFENIISFKETLNEKETMDNEIMLGLRKEEGINIKIFKEKYNKDITDIYPKIKELIDLNILILDDDHLKINSNDLYLQNNVLVKIL